MSTLVIDIETAGERWDDLDPHTQNLIQKRVLLNEQTDDVETAAKESLGLSPYTGEIIALGVMDAETGKGAVYFQAPKAKLKEWEEGSVKFIVMDEKAILEKFWQLSEKYVQFATFSGRIFDLPFIMIRSVIKGVKPKKDLMRGRYPNQQASGAAHIDLYDQLSFYGSLRFPTGGNLHMACRAFGINTPKDGEIDGRFVSQFFHDKKYKEIALYNSRDLQATRELYLKLHQYFFF